MYLFDNLECLYNTADKIILIGNNIIYYNLKLISLNTDYY